MARLLLLLAVAVTLAAADKGGLEELKEAEVDLYDMNTSFDEAMNYLSNANSIHDDEMREPNPMDKVQKKEIIEPAEEEIPAGNTKEENLAGETDKDEKVEGGRRRWGGRGRWGGRRGGAGRHANKVDSMAAGQANEDGEDGAVGAGGGEDRRWGRGRGKPGKRGGHHRRQPRPHHNGPLPHPHHNASHPHPHHGEHHHRGQWTMAEKVAHLCTKMSSHTTNQFVKNVIKKQKKFERKHGIKKAKSSYRVSFISDMVECCTETERMQCFTRMWRLRLDRFCDEKMPYKPWKKVSRHPMKQEMKATCCPLTGEERYTCFNQTIEQFHQAKRNGSFKPWANKEQKLNRWSKKRNSERNKPSAARGEDQAVERSDRRGRYGRRHPLKLRCCTAGSIIGHRIHRKPWMQCSKAGKKFVKKFKNRIPKPAFCSIVFRKCCIKEAKKKDTMSPAPEGTDVGEIEDVNIDDVNFDEIDGDIVDEEEAKATSVSKHGKQFEDAVVNENENALS